MPGSKGGGSVDGYDNTVYICEIVRQERQTDRKKEIKMFFKKMF